MNTTTIVDSTSTSTQPVLTALIQNNYVNYIDFATRGLALFVHVVYFSFVIFKKDSELQSRSCLFLHNVNFATFLIALVYMCFVPMSTPSFVDPLLNRILCRFTELFWMWIKYARVYSLLLLAFYRYTACCRLRWYSAINSRLANIFGLIFFCWVVSILIPSVFKYSFDTTFSVYFCTDGFADDSLTNSIAYYVVNTALSSMAGTVGIFVIYWRVFKQLQEQTLKLSGGGKRKASSSKLAKFARQFIILNVITSLTTVCATFIDFANVVATYPELNYVQVSLKHVRPVVRWIMLLAECLVPIVSIYYTTWNWHALKMWLLKRDSRVSGTQIVNI